MERHSYSDAVAADSSRRRRLRQGFSVSKRTLDLLPIVMPQSILALLMLFQGQWMAATVSCMGIVSYVWMSMTQGQLHRSRSPDGPSRLGTGGGAGDSTDDGTDYRTNDVRMNSRIHAQAPAFAGDSAGGRDASKACVPADSVVEELFLRRTSGLSVSCDGVTRQDVSHARLWQAIVRSWLQSQATLGPESDESVTLGMRDDGESFKVSLPLQGPHAMIAGTTGSGKSAMLQCWCLAMAMHMPPERLNLMLLDFKGGAGLHALEKLPHTVGCVSDLHLRHAERALRGLEDELRRREALVARWRLTDVMELANPPARMVVVIDEANALCQQIPDAMTRLSRLASLGRSLAINLIVCSQNPVSQLSGDIKANMAVRICLRVQDTLQSLEMIGLPDASHISPKSPGVGIFADGGSVTTFRSAHVDDRRLLMDSVNAAAAFCKASTPSPLFTAPLPITCDLGSSSDGILDAQDGRFPAVARRTMDGHGTAPQVVIGLEDDGVRHGRCRLSVDGNIAIVGPPGKGKTTLLHNIRYVLSRIDGMACDMISADATSLPSCDRDHARVWLVDDADAMSDPSAMHPLHGRFMDAIRDPRTCVLFSLDSPHHFRLHEYCPTRIVFPTGDTSLDIMSGISAQTLRGFSPEDFAIVGRAVLLMSGIEHVIQCSTAYKY